DGGGHSRPQRSAANRGTTQHWACRGAPDAALGARIGAQPAAHRQAGTGGGGGGDRRGNPLHRRSLGRAARGGRDRGGARRTWDRGAATSATLGLGAAAAGRADAGRVGGVLRGERGQARRGGGGATEGGDRTRGGRPAA